MARASAELLSRPAAGGRDDLAAAMRNGDESAFAEFIARHHRTMLRLARAHVPSDAVAEEVVQETWEATLRGLHAFEGRSCVKAWIFRILINRAKSRGAHERRTVPFASMEPEATGEDTFEQSLFQGPDGELPGHWANPPRPWTQPERRLLSLEIRERLREALDELPARQGIVVSLRDVEGLTSEEVCSLLGLSEGNQRILLHRGRTALRRALDAFLSD